MLKSTAVRANLVTSLVIFDSQVADLPLLYNALLPGSIGHTIQPHQDPIDHITQLLTETGATKLAIVAHGQPGAIQIGNGQIDRAMLETRSGLLQEWGVDSIGLYACEVGMDEGFVGRFAELTGANVSASTSKLGAGNWELDGGMELLEIDRLTAYKHTLATFTGTPGDDRAGPGFLIPIIGFTGGTLAELTDTIGDTFNAGDGSDFVFAGSGNDTIYGGAGNDSLSGRDGNDRLDGGDGSNILYGDDGDDYLDASYMRDRVDGGNGNDFLFISTPSSVQPYTLEFTGATAGEFRINGVETGTFTGIEQLYFIGDSGNDQINAVLANQIVTAPGIGAGFGTFGLNIDGYSGNDTVLGSANADKIDGGSGNDFLYGQAGNDTIDGGDDFDIIYGQAGNDTLNGDAGNDTIIGGIGLDLINGGTGTDVLYGEEDNDTINGGDDIDFLFGQAGDDTLRGDAGNDYIFGGIGLDTIYGGVGVDEIYGEADRDIIYGGDDTDFLFGQGGNDFIAGDDGNDYLVGGDGNDTLSGGLGIDTLNGESGDDFLSGDNGDDALYGNDGNDTLYGDAGNDFLDGGIGNDFLYGNGGNNVVFGGDGNDVVFGGDGVDYLYGGNGNDELRGWGGSDFLIGGAGSDTFQYVYLEDAGDTITDFDPLTDKLSFTALFAGYSPVVPPGVAAGPNYLRFIQSGTSTLVQIDLDGLTPTNGFITMATLNNVTASSLIPTVNVLV